LNYADEDEKISTQAETSDEEEQNSEDNESDESFVDADEEMDLEKSRTEEKYKQQEIDIANREADKKISEIVELAQQTKESICDMKFWSKCYRKLKLAIPDNLLTTNKIFDTLKTLIDSILIKMKTTNTMDINFLHQSSPNLSLLTEITSTIEAACCFMLITINSSGKLL
jgi:hypothetical protein